MYTIYIRIFIRLVGNHLHESGQQHEDADAQVIQRAFGYVRVERLGGERYRDRPVRKESATYTHIYIYTYS